MPPRSMSPGKQTTLFFRPCKGSHLKQACLACTLVHTPPTPVHVVTLKKIVALGLTMGYSFRGGLSACHRATEGWHTGRTPPTTVRAW